MKVFSSTGKFPDVFWKSFCMSQEKSGGPLSGEGLPLFKEEGSITDVERLFSLLSSGDTCHDMKSVVIVMFHRSWA